MVDENRRIPPPPVRPIPPRPNTMGTENVSEQTPIQTQEVKEKPKKEPLSEQSKNLLFICGGAFAFIVAIVCLALAIVL